MPMHGFKKSELDAYLSCIRNLKVGDKVEIYGAAYGEEIHQCDYNNHSGLFVEAEVVVVRPDINLNPNGAAYKDPIPTILLGSDCRSFYQKFKWGSLVDFGQCGNLRYNDLLDNCTKYDFFHLVDNRILIHKVFKRHK